MSLDLQRTDNNLSQNLSSLPLNAFNDGVSVSSCVLSVRMRKDNLMNLCRIFRFEYNCSLPYGCHSNFFVAVYIIGAPLGDCTFFGRTQIKQVFDISRNLSKKI